MPAVCSELYTTEAHMVISHCNRATLTRMLSVLKTPSKSTNKTQVKAQILALERTPLQVVVQLQILYLSLGITEGTCSNMFL